MVNFTTLAYTVPITFSIYGVGPGNAVGSLISTDTRSFSIPGAPHGSVASIFNITFNFAPQRITLPSKVVYGLSFSTGAFPPTR